jgi:hypothetical protein
MVEALLMGYKMEKKEEPMGSPVPDNHNQEHLGHYNLWW